MARLIPSLTAAVLAALVAFAATVSPLALAGSLLVVVIVAAAGWPTLLGLPTQRGSTTVLALCGAAAIVVMHLTRESVSALSVMAPVLGLSVVATFTHQLMRRDMRPRLVESVTGVVCGVVVIDLAVGWLAAADERVDLVLIGAAGVVVSALVMAAPIDVAPRWAGTTAAGLFTCAVTGGYLDGWREAPSAALIGGGVALLLLCLDRLFSELPAIGSRQAGMALGAAHLCSAGAAVYLIGWAIGA